MAAFNDGRCPKCTRRYGWTGEASDNPGCPRCGWRPSPESMAADQRIMDEFQDLLLSGKVKKFPDPPIEPPKFP